MSNKKILPPGMKLGGMDLSRLGNKTNSLEDLQKFLMHEMDKMYAVLSKGLDTLQDGVHAANINLVSVCRILGVTPEQLIKASYEKEENQKFMDRCQELEAAMVEEKAKALGEHMETQAEPLKEPGAPNPETLAVLDNVAKDAEKEFKPEPTAEAATADMEPLEDEEDKELVPEV